MLQIGLIGMGSGAAAALLFASLTSGTALSIPLAYLAPLPLMIAALGWSHWAALIGAAVGGIAIWTFFGGLFFVAFLAGFGLPAWWLGYLTMLARPVGDGPNASLEWYPPGRLVVWAAVLGAGLIILTVLMLGLDTEEFRNAMRTALREVFNAATGEAGTSTGAAFRDPNRIIEVLVVLIPPATAVMATLSTIINLWLAGRVVKFSNRLTRPWPVLSEMTFPPLTSAALALAVALSFVDGMVGILAGVIAASLLITYGVLGFAVLHSITRNVPSRPFVLTGVYAAVLVFGWPILVLCIAGMAEQIFNFRARAAIKRGPSNLT